MSGPIILRELSQTDTTSPRKHQPWSFATARPARRRSWRTMLRTVRSAEPRCRASERQAAPKAAPPAAKPAGPAAKGPPAKGPEKPGTGVARPRASEPEPEKPADDGDPFDVDSLALKNAIAVSPKPARGGPSKLNVRCVRRSVTSPPRMAAKTSSAATLPAACRSSRLPKLPSKLKQNRKSRRG